MQLYFSRRLGEAAPTYGRYFERVRGLLEQYRDIASGKLKLEVLDPDPSQMPRIAPWRRG